MNDFLDRYGDQLRRAERELCASPPPRKRRRARLGSLSVLAGLGAAALAVPALAVSQPWNLVLGRPELNNVPVSSSTSDVPKDQRDLLEVLRRPATDQDRGELAQHLARTIGVEFRGVRKGSIRVVTPPGGRAIEIFSAEQVGAPEREPDETDPLCISTGDAGLCGTTSSLLAGDLELYAGRTIVGLVPDGVTQITFHWPDGSSSSAQAAENSFWLSDVPLVDSGGTQHLMVSAHPTRIDWLAADGTRVGPKTG
jgi:hypothetical protein